MPKASDRPLEMEVRQEGPAAVICVHGSAGMNDADRMGHAMEELTDRKITPIILDMSDLEFICSAGLGAIIAGHLRSRRYDGDIRLVNPQPSVRDVLETTRLTKLFMIFPTVQSALAS